MILRCGTPHDTSKLDRVLGERLEREPDEGGRLYVRIKYVVIPFSTAGKIEPSLIRANHEYANIVFTGGNRKPDMVGNRYPYLKKPGAPLVQLFPLDVDNLTEDNNHIIYLDTVKGNPYSTVQQCEDEFKRQGYGVEQNVIHVYITDIRSGSSAVVQLGSARSVVDNAVALHWKTVGSEIRPGYWADAGYGTGGTLIHELGHCFGLVHPFPDRAYGCNSVALRQYRDRYHPDLPLQRYSNDGPNLDSVSNWNALDNRGRDYMRFVADNPTIGLKKGDTDTEPPYSCGEGSELENGEFECPHCFIDYGTDKIMSIFTENQSNVMRDTIRTNEDVFGSLTEGDDVAAPNVKQVLPDWAVHLIVTFVLWVFMGGILLWYWFVSLGNPLPGRKKKK